MLAYIGLDDTDNPESRGTGHLARTIADQVSPYYPICGITRHQLLFDPRVPYTAKNSSAAIMVEMKDQNDITDLFAKVREIMLADFQPGSDPGLCVAQNVPADITRFGQKAKVDLVTQAEARALAAQCGILLEGLGGTQDGVIGALAAVGLACGGSDGRYIRVGTVRDLQGWQPVNTILAAGVDKIQTTVGEAILKGNILADKLRPARRDHKVVLFAESQTTDSWLPIKLD